MSSVVLTFNVCMGFSHQVRKSTNKEQLFQSVCTADLLKAVDLLDGDGCLPKVYVEASDLLIIPSLAMDPISSELI